MKRIKKSKISYSCEDQKVELIMIKLLHQNLTLYFLQKDNSDYHNKTIFAIERDHKSAIVKITCIRQAYQWSQESVSSMQPEVQIYLQIFRLWQERSYAILKWHHRGRKVWKQTRFVKIIYMCVFYIWV